MRVLRSTYLFLAVTAVIMFVAEPAGVFAALKHQMHIGLYHLGVPKEFQITSFDGPIEIYDPFSRKVLFVGSASSTDVLSREGAMHVFADSTQIMMATYPLVFTALGKSKPFLRIRTPPYRGEIYRGSLAVAPWRDRLFAVNLVELEEYLLSVVPAEIGENAPAAALEAQAIAARSYALRNNRRHSANGFDLCDEVHCQVYRGIRTEAIQASRAVRRTTGRILVYADRIADTVYHGNCGGSLVSSQDVWHGAAVPYLSAHADAVGSSGFFCSPKLLADNSPKQSSKKKSDKDIPASHPSRGHRVGMCQDGAIGMAKLGYKSTQILSFYYPGTTLVTIDSPAVLASLTHGLILPQTDVPTSPKFGNGAVRKTKVKKPVVSIVKHQNDFYQSVKKWYWISLAPSFSKSPLKLKNVSTESKVANRSTKCVTTGNKLKTSSSKVSKKGLNSGKSKSKTPTVSKKNIKKSKAGRPSGGS